MKPTSDTAASIVTHCTPYLFPMRSFEVIASGVNRSEGRLRPTRPATALIRRPSVCSPDDPDVVVAKVSRFGFGGRSFEQSVHIFAPGPTVFMKSQGVVVRETQSGAPGWRAASPRNATHC
jgi:hypothetical protein